MRDDVDELFIIVCTYKTGSPSVAIFQDEGFAAKMTRTGLALSRAWTGWHAPIA